ncbi:hypothetical protein [Microbacterium sp. T32]|uniref:hypothetical protein n=1 Tax=Microbacterium sp. T32 TaxID=1776083 RepID=UPI0007ABC328|nr:hypothetical protein [Microbacterium sp. T32]KZE41397.1 hypothetical protein AVW09_02075 [Microbacterium sp. T32]
MSTWNSITIERPGALTLDTLPDALTGDAEIWEDRDEDDERVTIPEYEPYAWNPGYKLPERPGNPEGNITIEGRSKYRADDAIAALIELSKTTGRITHYQEWDNDGPGQETTVYENGEYIHAASKVSDMVPANLHELIANVRRYVRRDDRGDIYTELGPQSMEAVMALLDALDPQKAVTA